MTSTPTKGSTRKRSMTLTPLRAIAVASSWGLVRFVFELPFDPPWLAKAIATVFILAGGWLAITAQKRACRTLERLDTHKFEAISTPNFRVLAYSVAAGSILLTAGLWILNNGTITD